MSTVGQTEDETGADDVRQLVMFNSLICLNINRKLLLTMHI